MDLLCGMASNLSSGRDLELTALCSTVVSALCKANVRKLTNPHG